MWIMTQDKQEMINSNTVYGISVYENKMVAELGNDKRRLMGIYETREMAKGILKDMLKAQQMECRTYELPGIEGR